MSDYSALAINDVKSYLWNQIVAQELLDANDYYADGLSIPLIPIIPAQQIPEFNNLLPAKTHIIYTYDMAAIPQNWWMMTDVINFMVVSPDYEKIQQLLNFMVDLFRRYDESAVNVQNSSIISNTFLFHYTSVSTVISPEPLDEEGGLRMGRITIRCNYSRIADSNGRF